MASLTCVSENDDVPDWLVKAAEETDAMVRKVMPIVQAAQATVDVARPSQQFAEDTQAAQRYTEDLRAAQAAAGPSLLFGREVALAMDAGMRELFAAVSQQLNHRTGISFTGTAALVPFAVAGVAEAIVATDNGDRDHSGRLLDRHRHAA